MDGDVWTMPSGAGIGRERCIVAGARQRLKFKSRGRVAEFCSQTCRQPGYEQRKWARPAAIEVVAQHLAAAKVREAIRAEVWSLLREIGLVAAAEPPPMPKKPGKPTLRLVKPEPPADI